MINSSDNRLCKSYKRQDTQPVRFQLHCVGFVSAERWLGGALPLAVIVSFGCT